MYRTTISRIYPVVWLILISMLLSSCSIIGGFLGDSVKKPQVEFAGAKLSGLSFDAADFLFDLKITNPNTVGLKMAGFDYDFLINGNSFIKGKQEEELSIGAGGDSTVQLPISLGFSDLYKTFQSLKDQDNSTYRVDCGFAFDVPVLGVVNIPVSKEGELPLLKLPKVNLGALKLKKLTLTGADLSLGIKLNNPNAFSMILKHINYQFDVKGMNWVSGDAESETQVTEKGESLIEIPISLNFLQVGRSVYQLVNGDEEMDYKFGGKVDLGTSIPLLGQVSLPFDRSGSIKITR